ncbi:YwqG family protein [Longimicrobium sp.]|uniref:YwqG family protein n=1 Tax=Longimicrobium sp. TaxID=2029185 RepID=UPI002E313BBA|nr:YwqG family protein [Longimicrobium sp.]HEX6039070.1 YwqG family protein [Longimicrobium sp.]
MDTGRLEDAIRAAGLDAHRDTILSAVRPAIYIGLGAAGQGGVGQSRIGGLPDLPDSIPWPVDPTLGRLRSFLLQIRLAELPPFPENPLPSRGMLYLFADENEDHADQLLVYTGDEPLRPRRPPEGAELITDWYDDLAPHGLVFDLGADLPRWATRDYYALVEAIADGDEDGAEETMEALGWALGGGHAGKLLGHAAGIGYDPREDAYVMREVNPAWRYAYDRRRTLDMAGAARWTHLLTVDSVDEVNLMFGDAGYLQVLAHEDDLRRGDFSRVWLNLESS